MKAKPLWNFVAWVFKKLFLMTLKENIIQKNLEMDTPMQYSLDNTDN